MLVLLYGKLVKKFSSSFHFSKEHYSFVVFPSGNPHRNNFHFMTFVLPNATIPRRYPLLLALACGAELKATNVFDTTSPWVKCPFTSCCCCFGCFLFVSCSLRISFLMLVVIVFFFRIFCQWLLLLLELEKSFARKVSVARVLRGAWN